MAESRDIDRWKRGKGQWKAWADYCLERKAELEREKKWEVDELGKHLNIETERWMEKASVDFSGHVFGEEEGDFSGVVFPHTANFSAVPSTEDEPEKKVTFHGDASFYGAVFKGGADFFGATFTGDANFSILHLIDEGKPIKKVPPTGGAHSSVLHLGKGEPLKVVTFHGDANFSKVNFTGKADFGFVTFPKKADFSGAIFEGIVGFAAAVFDRKADFSGAIFKGEVSFICYGPGKMTFSEEAYFSGARFEGKAVFVNECFDSKVCFTGATFIKNANFSNFTFPKTADFSGVTFTRDANFSGACFKEKAKFSGASFGEKAESSEDERKKKNVTLIGEAKFSGATFGGRVDFSGAIFINNGYFSDASFSKRADCSGAIFSGEVDYSGAIFSGEAVFRGATFTGNVSFRSSKFLGAAVFDNVTFWEGALFIYAQSDGAFSLANAEFKQLPDFTQTIFRAPVRMDNLIINPGLPPSFPIEELDRCANWRARACYFFRKWTAEMCTRVWCPTPIGDSDEVEECRKRVWRVFSEGDKDEAAKWRGLKKMAKDSADHMGEMNCFAEELRERRGIDYPMCSMKWWASLFYEFFSDFGRGIKWPLIWWAGLLVIFAVVYLLFYFFAADPYCGQCWLSAIGKALFLSMIKSLPLIGSGMGEQIKEISQCLYGLKALPLYISVITIFQMLLSTLFIFLILLGLRNNFRIK